MVDIHIERRGHGHPLILVHGWGWHSGIWNPLIPLLEDDLEIFLIDLPGFGKSGYFNGSYSFENIAKQLLPLLPKTAAWLGWSLGGMFVWWLAIHYPERVTKLITVASSPKFVADKYWPGIASTTLKKFAGSLIDNHQKTLIEFLELQLRGSPHQEKFFSILQTQLTTTPTTALPALLGSLTLLQEIDLRTELEKIICPSLAIFGQNDMLVPAQIVSFISEQLPNGLCHVISKTGHIPFLTHREDFVLMLMNFLKI